MMVVQKKANRRMVEPRRALLCFASGLLLAGIHMGGASAARSEGGLSYAPPAKWVVSAPAPTTQEAPPSAPLRFVYQDQQIRIGPSGQDNYSAFRIRILKPEALRIGNVSLGWSRSGGSATVHHLRIIRDGQVIDVLKEQRFQIIQREGGMEQSILDGQLTALLQIPGLRVGDELEFAATIVQRDPTFGEHAYGLNQLPTLGMPGVFRYQLSWPDQKTLAWRATRDLAQAIPVKAGGRSSISYELRDPTGVIVNDGSPPRYNVRRLIEYSDFENWRDLSSRVSAMYDEAAILSSGSPLRVEAARIAAASADPVDRAQAALRLAQEMIRYVYVGLDGGNYRPAPVDTTWQRRFGDCKAKTVLLLALLRELKIEAEPVLVNALGDDGIDARLPSPAVFNHVLVRARIDGKSYWLDGTRMGDLYLDMLPSPGFRWALPLRMAGGDLEKVVPQPLKRPQFIGVVAIDARSGFTKPAAVTAQNILRDDDAFALRTALVAMTTEDADRAVRTYWRREMAWVEPDEVSWRYDERRRTLLMSISGKGHPDWEGSDTEGRSLDIIGAGFFQPELRRRPRDQDQTAPWMTSFPRFRCFATSIRLPAGDRKWRWSYDAAPMDRYLGGVAYWRAAGLADNIVRTVMSSRTEVPEISPAEARATNDAIAGFNNRISQVYQVSADEAAGAAAEKLPFGDDVDWTGDAPMCRGPATGIPRGD